MTTHVYTGTPLHNYDVFCPITSDEVSALRALVAAGQAELEAKDAEIARLRALVAVGREMAVWMDSRDRCDFAYDVEYAECIELRKQWRSLEGNGMSDSRWGVYTVGEAPFVIEDSVHNIHVCPCDKHGKTTHRLMENCPCGPKQICEPLGVIYVHHKGN